MSAGDGSFQAYGLTIVSEDHDKIAPGVTYEIKPLNTSDTYRWQVAEDLKPIALGDQVSGLKTGPDNASARDPQLGRSPAR